MGQVERGAVREIGDHLLCSRANGCALSKPSRMVARLADGRDQDAGALGQRVPVGALDGVLGDQSPADRDADGARPPADRRPRWSRPRRPWA